MPQHPYPNPIPKSGQPPKDLHISEYHFPTTILPTPQLLIPLHHNTILELEYQKTGRGITGQR